MITEAEINSIERDIKKASEAKELGLSLERLKNNHDFKTVIKSGYFRDEAVRLVHLKGDPNFQTTEKQQSIIKQMDSIAALNAYFYVIELQALQAEKSIVSNEAMLDEIRTGEAA